MTNIDVANYRAAKRWAKQEYDKEVLGRGGRGASGYEMCGPPHWDRDSWDRFKAQYGFYPFGMQDGAFVAPPTYAGAPDWVYEYMGQRVPPVRVHQGENLER